MANNSSIPSTTANLPPLPQNLLQKYAVRIHKLTQPQVRSYVPQLVNREILTLEEGEACNTGSDLSGFLRHRSQGQVQRAFVEVIGVDPVNVWWPGNWKNQQSGHVSVQVQEEEQGVTGGGVSEARTTNHQVTVDDTAETTTLLAINRQQPIQQQRLHQQQQPRPSSTTERGRQKPTWKTKSATALLKGKYGCWILWGIIMGVSAILILTVVTLITQSSSSSGVNATLGGNGTVLPTTFLPPSTIVARHPNGTSNTTDLLKNVANAPPPPPLPPTSTTLLPPQTTPPLQPPLSTTTPSSLLSTLESPFTPPTVPTYTIDDTTSLHVLRPIICNNNESTAALNFTLPTPFLHTPIKVPCPHKIKGLHINGNLTLENIHEILSQTPAIEFLVIDADEICQTVDDHHSTTVTPDSIALRELKFLSLSNITTACTEFLNFVNQINAEIATLVLSNVTIQSENVNFFESLLSRSLKSFKFSGELYQNLSTPLPNLTALHFNVTKSRPGVALQSIKALTQRSHQLVYFSSNVPLPKDPQLFSRLKTVAILNATFSLEPTVNKFSVSFIPTQFPHAIKVNLLLLFQNRLVCKSRNDTVRLTNVTALSKAVAIREVSLTAGCRIHVRKQFLPCRGFFRQVDVLGGLETVGFPIDDESGAYCGG